MQSLLNLSPTVVLAGRCCDFCEEPAVVICLRCFVTLCPACAVEGHGHPDDP